MDKKQTARRIEKLREQINEYRYNYHVLNKSIMSEAAADSLKRELTQLEEKFPDLITPDSPTQRVAGGIAKGFKSVRHSQRMLSLNDVFNEEELKAWLARIKKLLHDGAEPEFFCDLKMDGFACAVIYEDGKLVRAVTRGDGTVGEDVTANVRTIESVPLRLHGNTGLSKGTTEIRGEIVMYKDDFTKLNEQRKKAGLPSFANPRNTAAGTIRQLDPKLVMSRPLKFHGYDLISESSPPATYAQAYTDLRKIGFLANNMAKVFARIDEVIKYAKSWQEKRNKLPFHTDGLVIKINDKKMYDKLGVVGKAPRAAVAYKYPAEQTTTKVKDIFVSIGRTGSATPVAMLEPVVVAGSTVQMATLHNEGEVARKDIRIGDSVIIQKAGDVIPEVVKPLEKLRTGKEQEFVMPKTCPECGTKLEKKKANEAVWRCPNTNCPARSSKQMQHFASKAALDIEGMGEKNVQLLLKKGLIKNSADIYRLESKQLLELERFADISANKLVKAIEAKKNPPLHRFIYGLGIRHVGAQTAVDLANHYKTFDRFMRATVDELKQIEGVGEIVAESIVAWLGVPANQKLLEQFQHAGVRPQEVQAQASQISGKKFAITGTLDSMEREEAGEKIRLLGGVFQSSVGKDTDFLVVGKNPGASKKDKAKQYGTKVISEQELLNLLK